ncbi:hypothetical protein H9L39_18343 [Fusarium oxysporum f. sp. albedinis]|nr:hypothetical protein H9L39_18343 [Fusarium oxysporum f. sp. albedinis]
MSSKLIVVLGATGNQGGSVADVYFNELGYKVRAVTRNPSSAKAQALAARGAEVVQADLDSPATLQAAFKDANIIFVTSDFWSVYNHPDSKDKAKPGQFLNAWTGEQETQQLKNAIDAAAKNPTLERFIFSSLPHITKWSKGKYTHVYHFDSKARAEDYGRAVYPELWAKTSILHAGYFLSNYTTNTLSSLVKTPEGVVELLTLAERDRKFPLIAAEEDTGPLVKDLVQNPPGKNVIGYREMLTHREVADIFTKVTGLKTKAVTLPKGRLDAQLPDELKMEFEDNLAYLNEFGYDYGDEPAMIHPRELDPAPVFDTVEDYFRKHGWTNVISS